MHKFSKMLAASGLVVLSIGMAGCQSGTLPGSESADLVLQKGVAKLADVTSYTYNLGLKGDLKGPEGEAPASVNFDLNMKGNVELKDPKDPKFNLKVSGNMMADKDGGNAELEFRLNKAAMFLNLMKLEGQGAVTIPEEMKSQLIGKWWTLAIPETALEEMAKSMPQSGDANLTPEQKKIKALVEETKFFKNVQYKGTENVGGESSSHYTGDFDKAAFMDFVAKVGEIQGKAMTDADKTQMKAMMDNMEFGGDMYVAQNSGVLNKVKGSLTIKDSADKTSPSGVVTVELMLSDLNKSVVVEVPANAQTIPMEALGGLGL
jgi:hypothetical protein